VAPHPAPRFFGGGFGGFGGFGGAQEEETPRGNTIYAELEVTLRDLFLGASVRVVRDKNVLAPARGTRKCNCKQKVVTHQVGPGMYQQYTTRVCEDCPNVKLERQEESMVVSVEPGMADRQEISFFEEGEPLVDGEPGDLVFTLRTLPHPRFARSGDDLHVAERVSLVEALTGFRRELAHLDGRAVPLEAAGVTRPGQVVKVPGEGMPVFDKAGRRGDLYVTYSVAFPAAVTEPQKKALRELFAKAEWGHDEL
jgi:DnaJ family protein B protein 11